MTNLVALGDDLLLGDEDLLGGDLDPHVAPGHHDAVRLGNDLVNVVDALLVLNLGDDEDVLALLAEHAPDLFDTGRIPDEGGEDHVHALLHAKDQVVLVLLGDGGQIGVSAGQVASLPGAKVAAVLDLANDVIRTDLLGNDLRERVKYFVSCQ